MRGNRAIGPIILLALAMGCNRHDSGAESPASIPEAEVTVTEVKQSEHRQHQGLPGTVNPSDGAVIASKLMGTVAQASVDIGQEVSEGELLILLNAGEIEAQVEQAKARLSQLERNYEREKALLAQKATTAESVRTLEDEIRLAKAQLAEAQTMESYMRIRAPFDGIITTKEVRRGDLAIPGVPLLTLEGMGGLEVHVQVPDSLMALPYGTEISLDANGSSSTGRLIEWSPAADPESRTRLVKLKLPEDTDLRSGQYVRVEWPAKVTESLWIPEVAISRMGQMERVFTVEDGAAALRLIKSGLKRDGKIQILAGLKEGDRIILEASGRLVDGQPIRVKP